MRTFKVELPLPPPEASPNGRYHWGQKAKAVREYRETCAYLVLKGIGRKRGVEKVRIDLDFYLCRLPGLNCYYPRDRDNALSSSKAAVDSLKDARLIPNDSKKFVEFGTINLYSTRKEHQGRNCLVITIQEV